MGCPADELLWTASGLIVGGEGDRLRRFSGWNGKEFSHVDEIALDGNIMAISFDAAGEVVRWPPFPP